MNKMRLWIYFVAVMQALFGMVARVVGRKAQQRMQEQVNRIAQQQGYLVSIEDGQVAANPDWFSAVACRALLEATTRFATEFTSAKLVENEKQAVEAQMEPDIVQAARRFALR